MVEADGPWESHYQPLGREILHKAHDISVTEIGTTLQGLFEPALGQYKWLHDNGWSAAEAEAWVVDTIACQLMVADEGGPMDMSTTVQRELQRYFHGHD